MREWWPGPTYEQTELIPACMILCELLESMEGLLWVAVRNQGLAYSIGLSLLPEEGVFCLRIGRSASSRDLALARRASREVLLNLKPSAIFTEEALETGKSIAMGTVLRQLETHQNSADARYRSLFRGFSSSWVLARIASTTVDAVRLAYKQCLRKSLRRGSVTAVTLPLEDEDFPTEN